MNVNLDKSMPMDQQLDLRDLMVTIKGIDSSILINMDFDESLFMDQQMYIILQGLFFLQTDPDLLEPTINSLKSTLWASRR
jgi:hypothetical protein